MLDRRAGCFGEHGRADRGGKVRLAEEVVVEFPEVNASPRG